MPERKVVNGSTIGYKRICRSIGADSRTVCTMENPVEPSEKAAPPAVRTCPMCGARDIRPSMRRGLKDGFMRAFALKPYRCRACRGRFYLKIVSPASEAVE